jgi:hypothetical protein
MATRRPPSQKQRQLAEDMLDLCEQTYPKMFKDMLRVALMKPYDPEYHTAEFNVIADELSAIFLLRTLISNPEKFDWSYLKYYWRDLRKIVAKYQGNAKDPRIVAIDKHYSVVFWGLPKITLQPRPTRSLPREWWDFNPEREELITTVAQTWWGIHNDLNLKFDELNINNKRFENMKSIEELGSLGVVHRNDLYLSY